MTFSVVHLSDPQFGVEADLHKIDAVQHLVPELEPDLVVVSGDLTHRARHGEFQAAQRLADAARVIDAQPAALQLRYLQTLSDIATENSSTTIFPVPLDLLKPFFEAQIPAAAQARGGEGEDGGAS